MYNLIDDVNAQSVFTYSDGKDVPFMLSANDRADCCSGTRAVAKVVLLSDKELYFCGHHFRQHLPSLVNKTKFILDETLSLR